MATVETSSEMKKENDQHLKNVKTTFYTGSKGCFLFSHIGHHCTGEQASVHTTKVGIHHLTEILAVRLQ